MVSNTVALVLTCVLGVSLIVLSLYYGLNYFRVGRQGKSRKDGEAPAGNLPPVSVVMVAQNDAEWLRANLVYLLEQDYPDFEVVVVDYMSTDETHFVLQRLLENYSRLKVVDFKENVSGYKGKKYPLSIGIKSAKNDILILADPDCIPRDLNQFCWIREMVSGYSNPATELVLGYCAIQSKKTLFNWLQQYDNLDYSVEYIAAALAKHPFTGNGRNLSYKRSLFMRKNGFIYHYHEPDGADDMFVNQNANGKNTAVVYTPGSFTETAAKRTLRQWRSWRKHRTVTHRYYSSGLKLLRLLRPLSVVLFYAAFVLLWVFGYLAWQLLVPVLALKLAWQVVAVSQVCRRLQIKPVVYALSPLFEIYFVVSNTILTITPLKEK